MPKDRTYDPLPSDQPLYATKIPNKDCQCNLKGAIVGVDDNVHTYDRTTMVQFLPNGKQEPCEMRLCALMPTSLPQRLNEIMTIPATPKDTLQTSGIPERVATALAKDKRVKKIPSSLHRWPGQEFN